MVKQFWKSTALSSLACIGFAAPALAQTSSPNRGAPTSGPASDQLDEESSRDIVVTAQKRAERLQDVPIAITAVTSQSLSEAGVTNSLELNRVVPSLNFTKVQGFNSPFIRGVGTTNITAGDEPSVATYIDGVYQGTQVAAALPYNNVERVEILKGPQGTLYGRNATGGLISIITRDPTQELHARAEVSYGNYQALESNVYISGGLTNGVAADFSVTFRDQGKGYDLNLVNGHHTGQNSYISIRSKLKFELGDTTTFVLAGNYAHSSDNVAVGAVAYPGTVPLVGVPFLTPGPNNTVVVNPASPFSTTPHRYYSPLDPYFHVTTYGVSGTLNTEFGFADFTSISAYRYTKQRIRTASTLTAADGFLAIISPDPLIGVVAPGTLSYDSQQFAPYFFTQEFQLSSKPGGPFKWIVGAFGQWNKEGFKPLTISFKVAQPFVQFRSYEKTEAEAIYGQGTYTFDNGLSIALGARYGTEKKNLKGTQSVLGTIAATTDKSERFNSFTYRAAIDYRVNPHVLIYVSADRGYKSGLYNANVIDNLPAVRPETIYSYSAGIKTNPTHDMQFNVATYYYDYRNLQQFIVSPSGNGMLQNAPKAQLYGLEADLDVTPIRHLNVRAGISIEHSEYRKFPNAQAYLNSPFGGEQTVLLDVKGRQMTRAPKFAGTLGVSYAIPLPRDGNVTLAGNLYHSASFPWSPSNAFRQPAYTTLDLAADWTLPGGRFRVGAFARNLTDETYAYSTVENTRSVEVGYAPPRTYGVRLGVKY